MEFRGFFTTWMNFLFASGIFNIVYGFILRISNKEIDGITLMIGASMNILLAGIIYILINIKEKQR